MTAGQESAFNHRFDNTVTLTDPVYEEVKHSVQDLISIHVEVHVGVNQETRCHTHRI